MTKTLGMTRQSTGGDSLAG